MKLFLFLCILSFYLQVTLARKKPPNIVFILADDLGYNDIGYHNPDIISPNIDKLSKSGVRLENYYVQPICTPTRSQLLTGRYQIRTGLQHLVIVPNQANCLPLDEVILPQKLKEVGYSTHIIGKWHLGNYKKECLPHYRGFDTFFGLIGGGCDYYSKEFTATCPTTNKLFTGYDFYDQDELYVDNITYSTDLYRDRAVKIITEHDQQQPMFLYLPLQSVHTPLEVSDKYLKMYPNILNDNRRIYSAMVTSMDDVVGDIVKSLQSRGMWEDTLLIFSSDNGGQTLAGGNNWPLRGAKASLYEGGIKAVGFAHGVGVSGFRKSKELMHISDWFPTLLHVAGASTSGTKPLDGIDAWHLLSDPSSFSHRTELLHNIDPLFIRPLYDPPHMLPYPNRHGVNTTTGHSALRFGKWKLFTGDPGYDEQVPVPHRNNDAPAAEPNLLPHPSVRLFDIDSDPTENFNVASLYPNIVDKMLEKIAAYNQTAVPVSYPPCDPQSDPALHNGLWEPWM